MPRTSSIDHNFMQENFSVLFVTDLNTVSLAERSLTAAISQISSASVMLECWQNLSKLTNQRVYQILVYRNDLLLSLRTGVLSRPLAPLFYVFARCFLRCALTNWTPGRGYVTKRKKTYNVQVSDTKESYTIHLSAKRTDQGGLFCVKNPNFRKIIRS